jgi:hypothetical protein
LSHDPSAEREFRKERVEQEGIWKAEATQSGRCGSAAKLNPHRPDIAPALGLRAGG